MTLGLLCMSYGTARGPEDLEQYLTHIRRGRTPSPELLHEMRERYDAIGGRSPLIEITEQQVRALETALADLDVFVACDPQRCFQRRRLGAGDLQQRRAAADRVVAPAQLRD